MGTVDLKQLNEKRERLDKVEGKEKDLLKTEILEEEKKIKIEKALIESEERIHQYVCATWVFVLQIHEFVQIRCGRTFRPLNDIQRVSTDFGYFLGVFSR
jgi:hypothetical protein